MRRTALLVVAGASLALFACGGGDREVIGPAPEKEDSFALALELDGGAALTWRDQPDEFAYRVAGTVKYGPPCELVEQGVLGTEQHGLDNVLPPDTTRYDLPSPDDERLTVVLEVVAKVTALTEDGPEKPAGGGIAFTADAFCP